MTEQYLVGELSILLARLQALAGDDELARMVARLRREAEDRGVPGLASVEMRALDLSDRVCWASLADGNPSAFEPQAEVSAELREFGISAGLLPPG